MQRALDHAGLGRWDQLRAREIELEKLIGDVQAAIRTTVEQMMAAGDPEVFHLRSRSTIAIRLTSSAGCSSSPSTSRNENARAGFAPLRGRNVRNDSRTAPSSNVRCTAISVSDGWLQRDSTKAISSSAAAIASSLVGAPNFDISCSASLSTSASRLLSVASTICTSVDHPSVDTPRKPLRKAVRALPSSIAGSLFQNAN